ncbi:eukaryotic translation initiation factor 2 subunit alpha homolog [Primulina huaijiensis]|uniref:eukaryotic translation initiation factor 2 subunit alpha homolog n=1 Tax=Primulina huaijiensis TaxID=1492673 RepID=UPI003CC77F21
MAPSLDCRMYEQKFPEIDTPVMVQVKSINPDTCAYVLLDYTIEGMLSFTELSRILSVLSLVRVGRVDPVMVLHVDPEKDFVNLSKRWVTEDDATAGTCEEKLNKSKRVHSIMRHVAETLDIDLEAFKLIVSDPDSVLDPLTHIVEEINAEWY